MTKVDGVTGILPKGNIFLIKRLHSNADSAPLDGVQRGGEDMVQNGQGARQGDWNMAW